MKLPRAGSIGAIETDIAAVMVNDPNFYIK
jgi:hypothetical protein